VRRLVVVTAIAFVGFWIADSFIDTMLHHETKWIDELIRARGAEIWIRLLVTALVVVIYRARRARARLHLISSALAEAPDGIQIAGLDGKIAYSNRAVREIYGYSPDELLGKHVDDLNVDPTIASQVILPEIMRTGRWQGELDVRHKDGRTFPIWLTTSLVRDGTGKPIASVGVIRDISDRKRAQEAQRRYAEQLEEATRLKDLFADILRHDVLGPASAMHLSIEALRRQSHDPSSAKLLTNAARSSARLTELIDGAAHYAKLSAVRDLDFGTLDLGPVLRSVVADFEPQRAERNASVALELEGEYPARANPMIAEVFSNLLSNAIKYGPAGGKIAIGVRDGGDRWDVSVANRGEGIPDKDKEKVFTRFERLRKESVKGTGVGLAIAKRIVDLHGGKIWVEDNPGGGSVFHVAVPKA
jgi:PAS domain S-box-containing protein